MRRNEENEEEEKSWFLQATGEEMGSFFSFFF